MDVFHHRVSNEYRFQTKKFSVMSIIGDIPFFVGLAPLGGGILFKVVYELLVIRKSNPNNIFTLVYPRLNRVVLYIKKKHTHNCVFCVNNNKYRKYSGQSSIQNTQLDIYCITLIFNPLYNPKN